MRRPITLILLSITTLFLLVLLFSSFSFSAVLAGSLAGETAVAHAPTTDPLELTVHYGHDWVEGSYAAVGHTVWITVTESDGSTIKGQAELTTGLVPWWGGSTGFSTNWHGWIGAQPDIVPGDYVFGRIDNGEEGEVQIGTIDGTVDSNTDQIQGTIDAPWLTQTETRTVDCHAWGAPDGAPYQSDDVLPNGIDPYTCTWNPITEWDVQPNQDIGVFYHNPANHWVGNVFYEPTPEIEVEKWHAGNYASPGSVVVYGIRYANTGELAAENVLLTDTLPTYTTYAEDTSGIFPTIGAGNILSWEIGTLDPGEEHTFALTLDVSGSTPTGENIIPDNCAEISTTTPGDSVPDNDHSCAGAVHVFEDDVQLRIQKWSEPGDPTPGEEFSYFVDWCNDRGAAVGPVWLTDTLPSELTLLAWYPRDRENFWLQESFSPQELVLRAPGLPGDWCETLELRVELDSGAEISTTLENIATIYAAGDVEPEDNTIIDNSAHISPLRHDLRIEKQVHDFVPVPNGWVNYFIYYRNDGNVPVDVTITETIPAGLSFNYAHWGGDQPQQNDPFPNATVIGNQLIWDLGEAPVGYAAWFHIIMDIGSVTPGIEIENCITIDSGGDDSSPENNTSCSPVTINDNGPNLQVSKYHWWNGNGQIEYRAAFANIGDEIVNDVWVTDTLPLDTSWAGWWHTEDFNFEQERLDDMNQVGREISWHFDHLNPGERGVLAFGADLDSPGPLQWFTNTVEIDSPLGDVVPEDNYFEDVAFSGGEVQWVDLDVDGTHIWGYAPQGPIVIDTHMNSRFSIMMVISIGTRAFLFYLEKWSRLRPM